MMDLCSAKLMVRPAVREDHRRLANFLLEDYRVHRHLDWRAPLEWLGSEPFFIAEVEGRLKGVLACPPDPEGIHWIRLFAAGEEYPAAAVWNALFQAVLDSLPAGRPSTLGVIVLHDWFPELLQASGFRHLQDIVVLEWAGNTIPPAMPFSTAAFVRPMVQEDLPDVQRVDASAFVHLWQNSLETLDLAYEQAAYCTVAEVEDRIAGYQISTSVSLSGHLARLAVSPELQRLHIGYELVRDLLEHFRQRGAWRVTVNTQSDNHSSLALYSKIGFHRTGEEFPVYVYTNSEPGQAYQDMAK